MTIAARLAAARKSAGLSQRQLAAKVFTAHASICHYETGRHEPSLDTLVALSDVLGVSTDYLLKGAEEVGIK